MDPLHVIFNIELSVLCLIINIRRQYHISNAWICRSTFVVVKVSYAYIVTRKSMVCTILVFVAIDIISLLRLCSYLLISGVRFRISNASTICLVLETFRCIPTVWAEKLFLCDRNIFNTVNRSKY